MTFLLPINCLKGQQEMKRLTFSEFILLISIEGNASRSLWQRQLITARFEKFLRERIKVICLQIYWKCFCYNLLSRRPKTLYVCDVEKTSLFRRHCHAMTCLTITNGRNIHEAFKTTDILSARPPHSLYRKEVMIDRSIKYSLAPAAAHEETKWITVVWKATRGEHIPPNFPSYPNYITVFFE